MRILWAMAAACIAVLLIATLAAVSAAQQHPVHLPVTIVDPAGAFIPNAQVELLTPADAVSERFAVNSRGEAVVEEKQNYTTLRVQAPGFESTTIGDLPALIRSGKPIRVVLQIPNPCSGSCPVIIVIPPQLPYQLVAIPDLLALQPVQNLDTLPAHRFKRRR